MVSGAKKAPTSLRTDEMLEGCQDNKLRKKQYREWSFDGSDVLYCLLCLVFMFSSLSRFSNSLAGLNVPSSHAAVSGCPKDIDAIALSHT